jgi:hypothetical protein
MRSKELFQGQKRHDLIPLFIFLFPYIVGFTSDSTTSHFETLLGIGTGQYVYHDCSGVHTQQFNDVGIYIGKKFEGPYRLGLSAGAWSEGNRGTHALAFPDLALDWEQFSFGTTGIRFGSQNNIYLEGRWLDQPPFLTGNGALRAGFGFKFKEYDSRIWLGANVYPYNTPGVAAQIEFSFYENKYLFLNGRYGNDVESRLPEYGISIGMRIISF